MLRILGHVKNLSPVFVDLVGTYRIRSIPFTRVSPLTYEPQQFSTTLDWVRGIGTIMG